MALRAKVRGKVRAVSESMARRLRARGFHVEDTAQAVAAGVKPTPVVIKLPDIVQPYSPPLPPLKIDSAIVGHAAQGEPASGLVTPLETPATVDLTDEELERLTAPDAG